MRVLLIGEFSNVHWTLAEGLRKLGHEVTVLSGGDGWKNYKRDINLDLSSKKKTLQFLYRFFTSKDFTSYDVVQLIHFRFLFPEKRDFLNRAAFEFLKRNNKKIFLGALGDDYFWMNACRENRFRYSQFDIQAENINDPCFQLALSYLEEKSKKGNAFIADNVNGITAGLYDYYHAYEHTRYADKLAFIPLPINMEEFPAVQKDSSKEKVHIFMGVQKNRDKWKGTDILNSILEEFSQQYPDRIIYDKVSNLPFDEYVKRYDAADILVDQLYSYSVAMNSLSAMAKGKIVMGGGEPEMYEILNERQNFPVINVIPEKQQIWQQLEALVERKHEFPQMSRNNRDFIIKHHDYIKVAQAYVNFWNSK